MRSVATNLEEAVELYFEGENLSVMGFVANPTLRIRFDIPLKLSCLTK
jgi:hypothetical protein